ncbi:MAG TPA: tRNA 2-thiouridine(34) synthase MnmA [Bacteriovoracaceae bacterium]|nr:tRNA 2-thiouridine(34) synthase MnmA [Bacteriovoracaceae bacterium]
MDFSFNPPMLDDYGIDLTAAQYALNAQKTVVVGMSGGVDSSVAALLLKLQGYSVIGLFMKNWEEVNPDGSCPADVDYQDVIKVCEKLELPYYSVNFVKEYWDGVFQEFLSDYTKGHTPNPDILCNREIKFKVFFQRAKLLGADYLATGHYCQLRSEGAETKLIKGTDQNKDQTYFLYAVGKGVFKEVLFPIGHLPKPRVRELAARFDLATSLKKDSTGICFIGERNFKSFLSGYIQTSKGNFIDMKGKVLGQHDGSCFYTLGQRKGMGIGGPGEAWFVVSKNHERNEVVLAQGQDHPALYADGLWAIELNWLVTPPVGTFKCKAKVRYRQPERACTVTVYDDRIQVVFDRPERAMTPRQSVVFYQGDICMGGGIISEISPNYHDLGRDLPDVLTSEI